MSEVVFQYHIICHVHQQFHVQTNDSSQQSMSCYSFHDCIIRISWLQLYSLLDKVPSLLAKCLRINDSAQLNVQLQRSQNISNHPLKISEKKHN